MFFIYHNIPQELIGSELIPLSEMEKSRADLSDKYTEKYKGREEIMERKIPLLDCYWNEVIQFLPFHPSKAFGLQVELGLIPAMPNYKFFQIPLEFLSPEDTAIFFKTAPGEENTEVKMLHDIDFATIQDIPLATIEYYKSLIGTGELPFNYQFVPHILFRGKLDISNADIITL